MMQHSKVMHKTGVDYPHAGVAQLIERLLAKEEVQGLSPCTRTRNYLQKTPFGVFFVYYID